MLFLLGVEDNSLCNDRKYEIKLLSSIKFLMTRLVRIQFLSNIHS